MAKRTDDEWAELTRDLSARVAAFAPGWTDPPAGDPGVTILELFAFLTESVLARPGLAEADRVRFQAILARLDRAATPPCGDASLTRPNYYQGKVLGVDDFDQEQAYQRGHRRRHNRLLHGVGVVSGLEVTLEAGSKGTASSIVVLPGVAVSPAGDELVLCDTVRVLPCSGKRPCFVTISLVERPADSTVDGDFGRIEESAVVVAGHAIGPSALAIARLVRDPSVGWRLDPAFRAERVGSG